MNITVNARLQNGLLLQGGLGTGRQVLNDCEVVDDLPEMLHTFFGDPTRAFFFAARPREFCEQNNGFRTSVQGLAAYTIPKIDVQISGTFQNLPGAVVQSNANYGVIPGVAGPGPFVPFKTFQIVEPGELFVERLNQLDFRVSKIFRVGSTRTNLNFDFYNVTERQLGHRRELRVRPDLAAADVDPASASLQDQRAVRFLETRRPRRIEGHEEHEDHEAGSEQDPALRTVGRVLF